MRGCTQPCQWYDEFAFLKYNDIIFASATPANSQASLEARRNGKPYHICISTTPGDLNTPQGIYAKQFFDNAAQFEEKMYDWTPEEVQNYIKKNSQNDFLYIEFSYKQLGRSEEWFVEQCRALNMDLFKIKREILLQWNKSSDLSPFTEEQIELLYQNVKDPVTTLTIDNVYNIQIYKSDFNWRSSLMMGVDVSGGYSLDNSAFTIWDPNSGEIVATFKNNIIDTVEFSELIYKVIKTYFVNTCIIIERNSYGKAVIDMLLKTDISKNIHYELKREQAAKRVQDVKKQTFSVSNQNRAYGVNTDNNTRPMMIDLLREIINEEYNKINSKEIVEEIAGLERTKNNKIEHGLTTHDDMLFSFLVLRYVWTYGTNLGKFFINKARTSNTGNYTISPQDYVRRIQMVTNLNKNDNRYTGNNSLSAEFIREQKMLKKQDEEMSFHDKEVKRRNDAFNRILDLNSKESQKRFDNLYKDFIDNNKNNNFW